MGIEKQLEVENVAQLSSLLDIVVAHVVAALLARKTVTTSGDAEHFENVDHHQPMADAA